MGTGRNEATMRTTKTNPQESITNGLRAHAIEIVEITTFPPGVDLMRAERAVADELRKCGDPVGDYERFIALEEQDALDDADFAQWEKLNDWMCDLRLAAAAGAADEWTPAEAIELDIVLSETRPGDATK
jgi:hypothetical protein